MKRHLFYLFLLVNISLVSSTFAQRNAVPQYLQDKVEVNEPVVALINANVIDGTGQPMKENQTIVINDTYIEALGSSYEVNIPEGALILDMEGNTIIPGLVGLHNHTYYGWNLYSSSASTLYLASGVTTTRTTGSFSPYMELSMKRAIDAGQVAGPRMFVTGPYITGGFGGVMVSLDGPEDARRVVQYWAEEGVTWFKAYTEISREALGAAIDEAHKHGIKVTGHLCSVSFKEAIELGIDNLEHGFFVNTDYDDDREPDTCPADYMQSLVDVDMDGEEVASTIQAMIDNDVPLTSTLAVYENFIPERHPLDQRVLDALAPDVREQFLTQRMRMIESGPTPDIPLTEELFKRALKFEYDFVEAGGLLVAGVDPGGSALPGYGDQRNYELLREAGFSPEEVVQIMTSNGAKVLGIYDQLGSIEEGKLADLVVIQGNLPENDANIRNVSIVFKEGIGWNSEALLETIEGKVGLQ